MTPQHLFICVIGVIGILGWISFACGANDRSRLDRKRLDDVLERVRPMFDQTISEWLVDAVVVVPSNDRHFMDCISVTCGRTSYTVNKTDVVLCVSDEYNNPYDDDTVVFVLLHELAHTLSPDVGHTAHFYTILDSLVYRAIRFGILHRGAMIDPTYPTHADAAKSDG
jgi:hypothetical protein